MHAPARAHLIAPVRTPLAALQGKTTVFFRTEFIVDHLMAIREARKGEYATMERGTAGAPDHLQLLPEGVRLLGRAQRVEGDP